jgi:hypothetical protein
MTLIIQKPTGAKLNLAQTYVGIDDPDAAVYVAAVEAADGEALETATKVAIHSFVKGCKNDGIWPAIKASCILAGARTLTGALVPLVGTAPTNVGGLFVSGDYNRKTGLVGDGSTKYLGTNRNNNADPRDNKHVSVYATTTETRNALRAALASRDPSSGSGSTELISDAGTRIFRIHRTAGVVGIASTASFSGLIGASRSNSSTFSARFNSTGYTLNDTSFAPTANIIDVYARNAANFFDGRLAFYSIGESLDLALLDARVTDLINAFAAAIP